MITVIGAGVIGLYTTFELLESGVNPKDVRIIGQYVPGDFVVEYTSPYAGAYFSATIDEELLPYSSYTYSGLERVSAVLGPNCGLGKCKSTEHFEEKLGESHKKKLQFLNKLVVTDTAVEYEAWVFNPPLFTSKLMEYLTSQGVKLEKRKLKHIKDVTDSQYVFNCTGNGARTLGGVEDDKCHFVRGQVVVIRAPHIKHCVARWSEASTYVIPRPDSEEVVLGGFYQEHNGDVSTYQSETDDILKRTTQLCPEILDKDLDVIRVVAGLRPGRESGPRVEAEELYGATIIHNYGAEGCGYLMGLGLAHKAVSYIR